MNTFYKKAVNLSSLLLLTGLLLTACASAAGGAQQEKPTDSPLPATIDTAPTPQEQEVVTQEPTFTAEPTEAANISPDEKPPAGAASEFSTDFSQHIVPYDEILSGGPPKDGIPAIDDPEFINVSDADQWLEPQEPIMFVQVGEDARAYPIQVVIWHEIVNDTVGGEPLVVTFCPLCNTAIAFKRTVNGEIFDFGTTGRLRFSNLIMYDRQTETWWQQASGLAIAGELTGTQLEFYPASIIAWEDFKTAHPDGKVLSRDTGFNRSYGRNPYGGYDDVNQPPFLYFGPETPDVLPPVARVLAVELGDETVAYPFRVLEDEQAVNDVVGDTPIVVLWEPGTASALDAAIVSAGRDVGAGNAFDRRLDDITLTFEVEDDKILDKQTGSQWNVLGEAISGELSGMQLEPVVAVNHFWFSWAAFKPETRVYNP